uniref:Uncharacterized protein n=1 Tax=Avena sativa TaxID=4498 RepID=A0ACD5VU14_AVESA
MKNHLVFCRWADESKVDAAPYKLRRRNSATMRAQYINTKELRICIGTYNAAGKSPPEGLDIAEWLGSGDEKADMYVLGFQEVVPLNAGIVIGAEDGRTALAWEELIRDTLTRISTPSRPKYRCRSSPATPSRDGADEPFLGGTDTETDDDASFSFPVQAKEDLEGEQQPGTQQSTHVKTMSMSTTDKIGLAWPEQPLDLPAVTTASSSLKSSRSLRAHRSFMASSAADVPNLDLDGTLVRGGKKKGGRSLFVRIVSKQMVGIFLTIWVRRGLRRCVQNLKVSTVGFGKTGYIGNKGAVSASMSVYQTMFCFVCSQGRRQGGASTGSAYFHLAAGERPANLLKRNADVQEIHRRTSFAGPNPNIAVYLHRSMHHSDLTNMFLCRRIFWLGDLNYRIDVPYDRAHGLVAAGRERSAEAGAEEGWGVRRLERG